MSKCPKWIKRRALYVAVASVGLAVALPAAAQIESANLRGTVSSEQTVQAGVRVTITDVLRGYSFSTTTRADGTYNFVGLRPGEYRIRIEGQAEDAGEEVTLRVGQNARLNLIASPAQAGALEEVLVTGQRVEGFHGGGVGTSITPEMMDRLPQINRNFLSFAELAPGVQFTQESDGSSSIRGGAQHQRNVNVFLDGVSQKDYVLKGGVTGQDTSRGNPFPQSAVGEYQVITQNYKAEFEHVGSTAITAVTRSGTNQFEGDVFFDYTDDSLRASTPLERESGEKVESSQEQYGLTLAGPIIEDRLHYFMAYERKNNRDPRDVIPGSTAVELPEEYQELTGRHPSRFREDLFFGKIDWLINDRQELEASIKYRVEDEIGGFGGPNTVSYGISRDQEDTRINIKHSYNGEGWINDARFTYEDAFWSPRPLTDGFGTVIEDGSRARILALGAGQDYQNKGQKGWSLQNDVTFPDVEWFGNHVIKFGVSYKEIELSTEEQIPFNPQYYFNAEFEGPGTFNLTQPYKVEWGVGVEGRDAQGAISSDNTHVGLFVQDDWYITDRLALNLGVRWDYEETPSYKNYVTPSEIADSLRAWENIENANYDIENWISDGSNRSYDKGAWAPRLGFSYDLDQDGTHVVFGGYGRSYDRNQFDYLQLEQTKGTFLRTTVNFAGDPDNPCSGDNCLEWDPEYLTPEGLAALRTSVSGLGQEITMINNDLKTPYSDQVSLGLRSAWGDWTTEVILSRVESKDGFNWLLGNRRENGEFFAPGTSWGAPWGFTPEGYSNVLLSSNDMETKTNSLYLKIERPHDDNWGVNLAYTYSDATENWQYASEYTLDYEAVSDYGWRDSVGVADHRIVATGTYDLPMGVMLSGKWTWNSPVSKDYLNCLDGNDQCFFDRYDSGNADFKQVDLALSKRFSTDGVFSGSELRIRLDVLNVFDTHNWRSFDLWPGGPEGRNENFGTPLRDLAGPTRTAKFSVGWSW